MKILQDPKSPIESRQTLRLLSVASVLLTIVVCGSPYILKFMGQKTEIEQKALQEKQNDETFSQKVKESEARIKYAQIKAREDAAMARIRIENGCTFVDPPFTVNTPVTTTVVVKGKQVQRPMPDGTEICDRLNTTAVVKNGVATDLRSLGTNQK